ncbi:unnamed protein product, partial [Urochloa humidicola]
LRFARPRSRVPDSPPPSATRRCRPHPARRRRSASAAGRHGRIRTLGDGRPAWGTDIDSSRPPSRVAMAPLPRGISGDGRPPWPVVTTTASKKRRSTARAAARMRPGGGTPAVAARAWRGGGTFRRRRPARGGTPAVARAQPDRGTATGGGSHVAGRRDIQGGDTLFFPSAASSVLPRCRPAPSSSTPAACNSGGREWQSLQVLDVLQH